MEYIPLSTIYLYSEAEQLVSSLGYSLVDLKIVPQKNTTKISAVVSSKNPTTQIGTEDCATVHRALLVRLEALLKTENTYMEVTSPGTERNIKNAAEFALFVGRAVRLWDKTLSDWTSGIIKTSDEHAITIVCKEEGKENTKTVLYENIAKAKLL